MADVIEKDLTKVTSSDLAPITKPSSGTDKRYMRMVDKDGNSVDVEVPAFLRAAIRDELASVLESGDTGGGSVLSVIGGILKTRTDADLASVLGGVPPFTGNSFLSISPNALITKSGVYFINKGQEGNPDSTSQWIIITHVIINDNTPFGVQMAFAVDNNNVYYRMIWAQIREWKVL